MIRGTTPTHSFDLPIATTLVSKVVITYKQNGETVLEKTEADCTISDGKVTWKLSQTESLKFDAKKNVSVQAKVLTTQGDVTASKVKTFPVDQILNDEVLS